MAIGNVGGVGRLGLTHKTGVAYHITIDGVLWERLTDDLTGAFLFDDATGQPLYAQVP